MLLFTGALWNWHPHVVGHTPGLQFCCDRRAVPMVRIHFPPADSPSLSGFRVRLREKPGFSAIMQTIPGASCRQRRVTPSNIAPSSGGVSVGRYSSTAVLPDAVADI